MTFHVNLYSEGIRQRVSLLHADAMAPYIEQVLAGDLGVVREVDAQAAVASYGRHRFHVSVLKLMSGLAGIGKTLMDDAHPALFVGLGVIAAISSLVDSVRAISLDEAAVCQAIHDLKEEGEGLTVANSLVTERLASLSGQSDNLDSRYEAAVASLERLGVVTRERGSDSVALRDLIFFGSVSKP